MLCMNCSKELDTKKNFGGHFEFFCICGARYSEELVEEAEKDSSKFEEWEHLRKKKLFIFANGSFHIACIGGEAVHPDVYDLHMKFLNG